MRWCATCDLSESLVADTSASATEKSVLRALEKPAYMRSNWSRADSDVDGFAFSNAVWTCALVIKLGCC